MPRQKKTSKTEKPAKGIIPLGTGSIEIESGQTAIQRQDTGLWSLNRAFSGDGLPIPSIVEISGYEWSAKSTLSYYLLGKIRQPSRVVIADFEGCDQQYVARAIAQSGWSGKLKFIDQSDSNRKPLAAETRLEMLADTILDEESSAFLLDSVGAIYSISEEEGNIGEGRVGQRARIMGDTLRKIQNRMQWADKPKLMIMTNHVHQIIGGQGTVTAGGKAVHYYSATRLKLQSERHDEDGYWIVKGKVIKRRYTEFLPFGDFQFVTIPGEGVHTGLSAVQDCIAQGLATKEGIVKLNGKSFGYFKRMIDARHDTSLFEPFREALDAHLKECMP